jgi:hypothetical protein
VSLILSLLLAQAQAPAFSGTLPEPNAELDAAHACLRAGLVERVASKASAPNAEERWSWALAITERCETQINAAADSREAVVWASDVIEGGISPRQMLRSEALYFVDRLIREHYEAQR